MSPCDAALPLFHDTVDRVAASSNPSLLLPVDYNLAPSSSAPILVETVLEDDDDIPFDCVGLPTPVNLSPPSSFPIFLDMSELVLSPAEDLYVAASGYVDPLREPQLEDPALDLRLTSTLDSLEPAASPSDGFEDVLNEFDIHHVLADDLDSFPSNQILRELRSVDPPLPICMDDDEFFLLRHNSLPPGTRALDALSPRLRALSISAVDYYAQLHREEVNVLGPSAPPRAHVDGGSMASTTSRKDLLFAYRPFCAPSSVVLSVADKTPHRSIGVGYLKIPADLGAPPQLVPCYHTPTLPVTIVSPNAMTAHLRCQGYTSISNLDGSDCCLRLRHATPSRSHRFPLDLVRGLLYSRPLIKPSATEHCQDLPAPALHGQYIEQVASSGGSSCSACAGPSPIPSSPELAPRASPSEAPPDSPGVSAPLPDGPASAMSKLQMFLRTASQHDVSLDDLHCHALGVPVWAPEPPPSPVSSPPPASCSCSPPSTSSSATPSVTELLHARDDRLFYVNHLTRDQLRILWHQRLGHLHSRRVSDLHRFAKGIPNVPIATELDKCPICLAAKLSKAARGADDSRRATQCHQGLSVDFGFMVQASSVDSNRVRSLAGINGETCYCLIVDHYSGTLYGECFRSKAPPVDFVNRWLAIHGLDKSVPDKYVRFDLGGELGRCPQIVDLFEVAGYRSEPTAPDSSHQNGPGERPHQTIARAVRSMLAGAALPAKFWPYAFQHFLRLYNMTVHRDCPASPYELCTGKQPDLSPLRVFGCRVYALPTGSSKAKSLVHARTGIFLGFSRSLHNVLYYDLETETVKTCQHVAFDEAMNDLVDKPPNARLLNLSSPPDPDFFDAKTDLPDLDVVLSPFSTVTTVTLPFDVTADLPFGLQFDSCPRLRRAYVCDVRRAALGRSLRAFKRQFLGSYLVSVDGTPVFSLTDIEQVLTRLASSPSPPASVDFLLAPERRSDHDDRPGPLHLRLHDLRHVCAIRSIAGEDSGAASYRRDLQEYEDLLTYDDMTAVIARLQTSPMTTEERNLKRFTRKTLQGLSNWSDWDAAFDEQLSTQHQDGTFGSPVLRPPTVDGQRPNILRTQWSNLVKPSGTRKCRVCADGSKRSAPWLRDFAQTYASCIEQPCMRLFFALSAALGLVVTTADTTNAFQQSPAPSVPCYLEIDDAYASWHLKHFGTAIDRRTHVIPLLKALQGHPEAGALWERMITEVLCDKFGFQATTHERNLYRGTVNGALVLVCRQVDDYAIASADPATAETLISMINEHVTTSSQGIGTRYNGVDVEQTRDYVRLHCEVYIDRVLQTHGWETPSPNESDRHDIVPLTADVSTQLNLLSGPAEGTPEHSALATAAGFSFRQLLGELIYAYVICRLDIGYAVTFLSRFSTAPHADHYSALKRVCKYLRATKAWGIVYWRQAPVSLLPAVPLPYPSLDQDLPTFPRAELLDLVGYVDAAHATDLKTRRSVSGMVFVLAGGAIAYKSKLQATVATSSTEAEFIAAVSAAKLAKYLRSVLRELGFPPSGPTLIYEDNMATIAMVNENKPTTRSRHIDIQHFALQEWRARGIVKLVYLATTINPADQATKALGWILHSRHARRAMGHYGRSDC